MTAATYNWTWQQGEDLVMSLVYKDGPEGEEAPVDLTGYSLRMDMFDETERVFTFNSDDIADPTVDDVGASDNEAVLGADGSITITVPRSITLPGGDVFDNIGSGANKVFNYDVFLRSPGNKQQKILRGQIVVETSYTLWQ